MAGNDLVLKISADTTNVASGLKPMTDALGQMEKNASQAGDQLAKLDAVAVSPTVDDSGLKAAAATFDDMGKKADNAKDTLTDIGQTKIAPPVDASTVEKLKTAADESGKGLKALAEPVTLSVHDQAIQRAQERIKDLKDQIAEDVEMGVDTKPALREISTLERSISELTEDPATIDIEVDSEDADFAFESMGKLKRGVRSLTDAVLEVGDGVKALPSLVSAGVGSFTTLNASMSSFIERQAAAGANVGRFTSNLGKFTSFLAGPWGLAIGGGLVLLSNMINSINDASEATTKFAESLDYSTGAMDRNNRVKAFNELKSRNLLRTIGLLNLSTTEFTKALAGDPVAAQRLVNQLDQLEGAAQSVIATEQKAGAEIDTAQLERVDAAKKTSERVKLLLANLQELTGAEHGVVLSNQELNAALSDLAPAAGSAATAMTSLAGATTDTGIALSTHEALWLDYTNRINDAQTALDKMIDSLDLFNSRTANARQASSQYQENLDALTKAIKENGRTTRDHGKTLDDTSAQGRANIDILIRTAQSIETMRKARLKDMETSGETATQITDDYGKQRTALYNTAHQMGLSKTAAKQYVDTLLGTPDSIDTRVNVTGTKEAEAALDQLTKDREASIRVHLAIDKYSLNAAKRLAKEIEAGNVGPGGLSATPPPAAAPTTMMLQPRIYLDSRPIRYSLRSDVQTAVSSTVAATKKRGRMW